VRSPKSKEPRTPATPGLELIIAYKALKAPLMLGVGIWLTIAPSQAYEIAEWVAEELTSAGRLWSPLGQWIATHLSWRTLRVGAVLAFLDGLITLAEVVLLVLRKPWSEWLVAFSVGSLLPFELLSVVRRPRPGKLAVFAINVAVFVYLVRRRINQPRPPLSEESESTSASISRRT
jgi:hypothetical protein